MTALKPHEDLDGEPELFRRTLGGQALTQPCFELTVGPTDEPRVLFEERSQPGMVVLPHEVGHHERPRGATVEPTIG